MIAALVELWQWIRENGWALFLATVAAYAHQHYAVHGPPADLLILPGLAVAMFLVFPLWAVVLHDSSGRVARVIAAIGCAAALAPALVWAYAPDGVKLLKADPSGLVAGGAIGLALVGVACRVGRVRLERWGLGPGEIRTWVPIVAIVVVVLFVGVAAVAAAFPEFVSFYPRYKPGRTAVGPLLQYQLAMAVYMFAWEFLFRGFMLFGLARYVPPLAAILAQTYPFFLLHENKPEPELVLSWFGGVIAGWFCWRVRSMWPAALLHAAQYSSMELVAFAFRHWI